MGRFDIETFVAECQGALGEGQPRLAVKAVLERVVSDPGQIEESLGPATRSGLIPLFSSPELTILQTIWPPGVDLYPHDHGMWACIGIYGGREDNTFYRRTPEGITSSGGTQLGPSDVALLGDDTIHSVKNPSRDYAAAIHIYGGDYFEAPRSEWDPDTLEERPFDVEHARAVLAAAEPGRASSEGFA